MFRPDQTLTEQVVERSNDGQEQTRKSAMATFDAIRRIKAELPGALTHLGLSNASFGLKPAARGAVNSVFLYHCLKAGLDTVIVNPKDITPYPDLPAKERELACGNAP